MTLIQRPIGYEYESRDCTVRALSLASNISYPQVHEAWKEVGRKDKHKVYAEKYIQKVCKILNINAKQVKRHGTIKKLISQFPQGNLFCLIRGHAFALIDGVSHGEDNLNKYIEGAWKITKQEETK